MAGIRETDFTEVEIKKLGIGSELQQRQTFWIAWGNWKKKWNVKPERSPVVRKP